MSSSWILVPDFPCADLDGTPWPNCNHQQATTDPVEITIIRGVMRTILDAGIPSPFARAGELIKTSWGCEKNKHKKYREGRICSVEVGLSRHPRSMFYRPSLAYYAKEVGDEHACSSMVLRQIERRCGAIWEEPIVGKTYPNWAPFRFRLEWISPNHGGIERSPFMVTGDEPEGATI